MSLITPWYQTPEKSGCPSGSLGVDSGFCTASLLAGCCCAPAAGSIKQPAAKKMPQRNRLAIWTPRLSAILFPVIENTVPSKGSRRRLLQIAQDLLRIQLAHISLGLHGRNAAIGELNVLRCGARYSVLCRTCRR